MHIEISELGKTNIRKRFLLEMAVYGLLTAVYTSMFFFGALYPVYGIPAQAVEKQAESGEIEADEAQEADEAKETDETKADEEIVYKSLLLEKLKEWF